MKGSARQRLSEKPFWVRNGILFLLVLAVLLLGCYGMGYNASTFVYNQF